MAAIKKINSIPLIKFVLFFLAGIGLAMAIRRLVVLGGLIPPLNLPGNTSFDQGFGNHPLLTLLHIVPGALFMVLGPIQFMPGFRARHIQFHRWSGRIFMTSAYVIGITAIVLPFLKRPIGGITEAAASVFFSVVFLVCISLSLRYILTRHILLHREWMVRAFSIGLAISTVRLITIGVFAIFKVPPQDFMGTAFWIGFTLHLLAAELWINYTRKPFTRLYKASLLPDANMESFEQ